MTIPSTPVGTLVSHTILFDTAGDNEFTPYEGRAIAKVALSLRASADTTNLYIGPTTGSCVNLEFFTPADEQYLAIRGSGGRAGFLVAVNSSAHVEIVTDAATTSGIALSPTADLAADPREMVNMIFAGTIAAAEDAGALSASSFTKAMKKIKKAASKVSKVGGKVAGFIPGGSALSDSLTSLGDVLDTTTFDGGVEDDSAFDCSGKKARASQRQFHPPAPTEAVQYSGSQTPVGVACFDTMLNHPGWVNDRDSDCSDDTSRFFAPGVSDDIVAKMPMVRDSQFVDTLLSLQGCTYGPPVYVTGRSATLAAALAFLKTKGFSIPSCTSTGEVVSLNFAHRSATLVVTSVGSHRRKIASSQLDVDDNNVFIGLFVTGWTFVSDTGRSHEVSQVADYLGATIRPSSDPSGKPGPTFEITFVM
jgi:hypothetical protein